MKTFISALRLLTIIPAGRGSAPPTAGTTAYFPLVGLIVGICVVAVSALASRFGPLPAAALALASWIWVTGALHLDGFSDTADALSSGESGPAALDIMRDPHLGGKAAVIVSLLLIAKFAALAELISKGGGEIIIVACVISRFAMVVACATSRYPREDGMGRGFIGAIEPRSIVVASLMMFAIVLPIAPVASVAIVAAALANTFILKRIFVKRWNGLTGDNLGAVNETSEVIALFVGCLFVT